jgi:lipoyl(octanoyl) transferase
MTICEVIQPGRMAYQQAWEWQNRLAEERSHGDVPDRLLLLEHPPTYTLGSSGHDDNLLLSEAEMKQRGIDLFRVDRGGDITYHGPGQLVGYPIIQLPRTAELRTNVTAYVRGLEQVIIRTLADYDIAGKPIPGLTGVWVDTPNGEAKICAIGVKINVRAVTKHGFAFNLNTDLSYFEGIVPCGIRDKGVTSLAKMLGLPVNVADVTARLIQHFGAVFALTMVAPSSTLA